MGDRDINIKFCLAKIFFFQDEICPYFVDALTLICIKKCPYFSLFRKPLTTLPLIRFSFNIFRLFSQRLRCHNKGSSVQIFLNIEGLK